MFTVRAMIVSSGFPYGVIGFFFFAIIVSCLKVNSGRALNDYILHFEPVFFDQHHLRDHHRRSIRSTMDRYIHLQFVAYKRVFRLRLERDPWVFADHTEFSSSDSTVHYDTSRALIGHVEGEENSSVQGVILSSGLFDGTIRIGDEELYVEPAQNYFSTPPDFHSVIYRLSDVHYPETNRTCITPPQVASKLRHQNRPLHSILYHRNRMASKKRKMHKTLKKNSSESPSRAVHQFWTTHQKESMQSLYQDDSRITIDDIHLHSDGGQQEAVLQEGSDSKLYWRDLDSLHYTESGGSSSSEPYGVRSVQRTQWPEESGSRRGSVAVDRRKSTCLLYLQADHLFYRRLGGEEACIDAMTRHVQRVNSIYRNTA